MSKLRIYYQVLGAKTFNKEVTSPEEAKAVIDGIADFVNQMIEEGIFPDHCSSAGLEEWDEEEQDWVTWYDEDGYDFDEHLRRYDEEEEEE